MIKPLKMTIFSSKRNYARRLIVNAVSINALMISPEPVTVFYTPNSIIHQLSKDYLQYVGTRGRFSTCTGVAWFLDSHNLISANLLENSLQTYGFTPYEKTIFQRDKFNENITLLGWPENLSASKDGKLLAISNSYSGKVNIYSLDPQTASLDPSPLTQVDALGDLGLHGVRFSPDGKYLGYVTYDGLGKIRLFQINAGLEFSLCYSLNSTFEGLAPKGLDFSPDLKFVAICYSSKIRSDDNQEASGKLAIFRFDAENGNLDLNPVSEIGIEGYLNTPEDVLFYSDDSFSCLLVSNQGNDTITAHDFDPESGYIYNSYVVINSPEGQLNFPHGISISPDGKYLAVSNYGDDKICIYKMAPD